MVTVVRRDTEDPSGRGGVDVVAGLERGDQPGILGEVCDAAQFDLVVVRHQQHVAGRSDERLPKDPPGVAADRDVVQVRLIGAEPSRAGDRLVERGPDPIARTDLGEEALAVGRPKLLHLAIGQEVLDDRMVTTHLLERLRVGRIARLRLLLRCQAQLVEEHLTQLLGGVDVEVATRVGDDQRTQALGLVREVVA